MSRNPFNDRIISSASEDGKIMIWQVPRGFTLHVDAEVIPHVDPVAKLSGHPRYDCGLDFYPPTTSCLSYLQQFADSYGETGK
jgi:coronin-1B/1C/6